MPRLTVLAPMPPVHDSCGVAAAFLDVRALRGHVFSPVSDRDSADRVIVAGYPEFSAERLDVFWHDPEEQAPRSSSTAVSSISSAAIPVSIYQYGAAQCASDRSGQGAPGAA